MKRGSESGKKLQVGLLMIFFQRLMDLKSGSKISLNKLIGHEFNQQGIILQTVSGDGQYVSR
jgi:hypothetical protein